MKPIVLVILDGWGQWSEQKGNAIAKANLPTFKKLDSYYPKLLLQASGISVGLPWGTVGNSEVGHQTIGTGQVIYQYLPVINKAIQGGSFFENELLVDAFAKAKEQDKKVHLLGLMSDGSVHSHIEHLIGLLELAQKQGAKKVFIHGLTDGRDTAAKCAQKFVDQLQEAIDQTGVGKIATLAGRYYTMDRNENWDRIEKGFLAMTAGQGATAPDAASAIANQYAKEIFDESLEPTVLTQNGEGNIEEGDTIIFFNYRKDRARQITQAFTEENFDKFPNKPAIPKTRFITFTEYGKDIKTEIVFPPQEITVRLGEIIAKQGKKQLRIAETEKFAHVTFFFNGGLEKPLEGEERKIIPSKKVKSYEEVPAMSALELTDELEKAIAAQTHDFILVNYANPDMVGHTGNLQAGIEAVQVVDTCLDRLIKTVISQGGALLITADHGNVEEMINLKTGANDKEHSANPVPCWFVNATNHRQKTAEQVAFSSIQGMIVDVPPTILELFGIEKPHDMVGTSLLSMLR